MIFGRTKTELPTPDNALPGRAERTFTLPDKHAVLGTPIEGPVPDGFDVAIFGLGCFWGEEKMFWELDGVYSTSVGYAGGVTPNPSYEEVCSGRTGARRGRPGRLRPVEDHAMTTCSRSSGRPTTRRRACGRATTSASQYRSVLLVTSDAQAETAEKSQGCLPEGPDCQGLRRDHHVDRAARRVLLRRGLPPAVPAQEPARLLPHPRDWCEVLRRLTMYAASWAMLRRPTHVPRWRQFPHDARNEVGCMSKGSPKSGV